MSCNINDLSPQFQEQIMKKLGIDNPISKPKKSKYHNKKTLVDNIIFDSMKESQRYSELMLMQRAGLINALATQVPFNFPSGVTYITDFVYYDMEEKKWVVEDSKGVRTKEYIIKKKLMKEIGILIKET